MYVYPKFYKTGRRSIRPVLLSELTFFARTFPAPPQFASRSRAVLVSLSPHSRGKMFSCSCLHVATELLFPWRVFQHSRPSMTWIQPSFFFGGVQYCGEPFAPHCYDFLNRTAVIVFRFIALVALVDRTTCSRIAAIHDMLLTPCFLSQRKTSAFLSMRRGRMPSYLSKRPFVPWRSNLVSLSPQK